MGRGAGQPQLDVPLAQTHTHTHLLEGLEDALLVQVRREALNCGQRFATIALLDADVWRGMRGGVDGMRCASSSHDVHLAVQP
jgi:hypothetical protein